MGAVKANDKDFFVSTFGCFDSAQCHFVILSENSLDIRVGLQHIFSDSQAFAAVKISRLFGNNCKFLVGYFMEPSPRSRVADAPGMPSSSATFTFSPSFLDDVFGCHFAAFDVVRSDEGGYCAFIGAAVERQNGDAGFVGSCHRS